MKVFRSMRGAVALVFAALVLAISAPVVHAAQQDAILHPADLAKIVPTSVFFRGQSATTQLRNSGGVRFADGALMFAVLVDNSG